MMFRVILLLTIFSLPLLPSILQAEPDARMQVELDAEKMGVKSTWLHSHIKQAAEMALPQLWHRIVPRHAQNQIPKNAKAVRFLKRAMPNETGVTILFSAKRVFSYLKQNRIPYYAEQSGEQTAEQSVEPPLITPAAPAAMQQPTSVARQSTASLFPAASGTQPPVIELAIEHRASLPEQVLLEQDLAKDPHVLQLTLKEVNRFGQRYTLRLKQPNDRWLAAWFASRGMTLTQSVDGWVAR